MHKILREWRPDWLVSGRSPHTIDNDQRTLVGRGARKTSHGD